MRPSPFRSRTRKPSVPATQPVRSLTPSPPWSKYTPFPERVSTPLPLRSMIMGSPSVDSAAFLSGPPSPCLPASASPSPSPSSSPASSSSSLSSDIVIPSADQMVLPSEAVVVRAHFLKPSIRSPSLITSASPSKTYSLSLVSLYTPAGSPSAWMASVSSSCSSSFVKNTSPLMSSLPVRMMVSYPSTKYLLKPSPPYRVSVTPSSISSSLPPLRTSFPSSP